MFILFHSYYEEKSSSLIIMWIFAALQQSNLLIYDFVDRRVFLKCFCGQMKL